MTDTTKPDQPRDDAATLPQSLELVNEHITAAIQAALTGGAEDLTDAALADYTALIQDQRARLMSLERDLAALLGKRLGKASGYLTDGRLFQLQRAADRKEWDHDDWKRDVRRAIVQDVEGVAASEYPEGVINGATGEAINLGWLLYLALNQAQEVHGSTAPRSTALRKLGLYAGDYCTSTPAGWRLTVTRPTEKKDTDD